ncbi:ganglioside-induced differentiation-associated protein 1-like, partial [Notothenia coriiceps]|uniref:Ganglioside-induced differentiation-associated protein 1-like n=1 Tax=Notothenia coriiceps TaxID=8208 RepID=A0A6I9PI36_9TELE
MAFENPPETQEETASLIEKLPEQDAHRGCSSVAEQRGNQLILYHWTQSFNSQKVRLAIAEKGLRCKEYDVSLPLSEHNEPWFMHLNPTGEVPVLVHEENILCDPVHIMDYLEHTFTE